MFSMTGENIFGGANMTQRLNCVTKSYLCMHYTYTATLPVNVFFVLFPCVRIMLNLLCHPFFSFVVAFHITYSSKFKIRKLFHIFIARRFFLSIAAKHSFFHFILRSILLYYNQLHRQTIF